MKAKKIIPSMTIGIALFSLCSSLFAQTYQFNSVSASSALWPASNAIDANTGTQ